MKKEHIMGIGLVVLIAGIAGVVFITTSWGMFQISSHNESDAGQIQNPSGNVAGGSLSSKIVVNAPLSNMPDKVTVYKTVIPDITKTEAIAFARKFNITDFDQVKEGDEKLTISSKDLRKRIMLFKNGGQFYVNYDRSATPNGIDILENLPSDTDAEKIATSFLKERGLLPDGAVIGGTVHQKAYSHSNGTTWVSWEDILVYYTRELNGMKVEGTQFEVEVGGHGDIIRFFSNWKDYEAIGEYPIKTRDASINTLEENGISATTSPDSPDIISINNISLAYHTSAVAYKEDYLEPVYVFQGDALKNGTVVKPVKEFVPALTNESEKSLSSI